MVGFELESENIAFVEPEGGMVIETNTGSTPALQAPSRAANPEWWEGPYCYNSQNRLQYVAAHRERFGGLRTVQELVDFSFDVHAPGRICRCRNATSGTRPLPRDLHDLADRRMRVTGFH